MSQRFALGRCTGTQDAIATILTAGDNPARLLALHAAGVWGDLSEGDKRANDSAIQNEGDEDRQERVLSCYTLSTGERIWIQTEWDRSVTTILLPSEY